MTALPSPHQRRPPLAASGGDDSVLDSLVVLVAENLGYTCGPAAGDSMVIDGPLRLHVGMKSLRQLARLVPRDDWPALVADHVSTIITALEEPLDLSDFGPVQHLLRSRIYPQEADNGLLAARPFAPGLIEAIVVDTPTTVRTVAIDETAAWPVQGDALFTLARSNVRSDAPLEREDHDLGGVEVSVLQGWTFYAATHLGWLDDYIDVGPQGALAVVPNRSMIAAHALKHRTRGRHARGGYGNGSAVAAATQLYAQAQQAYDEGPGSLSPHLFWWRDGALTLLDIRFDGDDVVLPDNLLAALDASTTEL